MMSRRSSIDSAIFDDTQLCLKATLYEKNLTWHNSYTVYIATEADEKI